MRRGRALAVGGALMPIFNLLTARARRRNMKLILGPLGWDQARLAEVDRGHARYFARWLVEVGRLVHQPTAEIADVTVTEGESLVQQAQQEGRGVLLLMSHLGTNLHMPMILAHRGMPVSGVFNARSQPARNYFANASARFGVEALFVRGGAGLSIRRALRAGRIVTLASDVGVEKSRSRWMPLGAGFTPIDIAPASLALRAGCAVLTGDTWQQPDGRSYVMFRRNDPPAASDEVQLSLAWVKHFETTLLAHPEQWWLWGFADFAMGKTAGEPLEPASA
jgi:lauroyl/myristoyl acyltransferase